MIIHIVRHAEAIDRTPDVPEEHRYLTPNGRKRFRRIAKTLKKSGIAPEVILTSPLLRAVQTADILAEGIGFKGELQVSDLLAPGFRPDALDDLLRNHQQSKEVAIVGHEPDLGILAQMLLGEREGCTLPKGAVISLKKSSGNGGHAVLLHFVTGGGNMVTSRSKTVARLTKEHRTS